LLWKVETKGGHSSPSIWGNHLFLTSFDSAAKEFEVAAYDRKTGARRWRQAIPAPAIEKVHAVSSPATATPVVDGERVYVYFGSLGLFCYDFDGKPVWNMPLPTSDVNFGSGTSPLLAGDSLILARDDTPHHMLSMDAKTGKLLWDVKLGGFASGAGHASPVV